MNKNEGGDAEWGGRAGETQKEGASKDAPSGKVHSAVAAKGSIVVGNILHNIADFAV